MISKSTLSIGIAAYNAEKNIKPMLSALLSQKQNNYILETVIVHSDDSSDQTATQANSLSDNRIRVIDNKQRKGFAGSLVSLLNANFSDIMIVLNDDIKITDQEFLNKMVQSFLQESKVGLVCGNPQPLQSQNFIQAAVNSSFQAYYHTAIETNSGNNIHTCNGKILGFSKSFISSLQFPSDYSLMGNVDVYVYFACLKNGFSYRFVKNARVYYPNPSTVSDYLKSVARNNNNDAPLEVAFDMETVHSEEQLPKFKLLKNEFLEFIKNPIGSLFILLTGFYLVIKAKFSHESFNPLWDTISTTKNIK